MTINCCITPRYCGTEIDGFEPFPSILFQIEIDVGNRDDNLVTGVPN